VEWLYKIATIQDFTKEILQQASLLREKHSISYWDSLIVAAALESNCRFLISEDMQHGQKVENLTIRNIFAD
jgi:predicted nucleic acid-binding protein